MYLSVPQAVLGGHVEIPTLEAKVKVKIELGIQPGKVLRLRNKGLPDVNGYGKGDLLVRVNVWIPKNLNKEERKTFEKYLDAPNFEPKPSKSEKNFFEKMKDFI